jgi:HlyD family secretion protein
VRLALLLLLGCADDDAHPTYRTAPLSIEDVERVVTATGTLAAAETVTVGTQVSGVIAELPVDYNDVVVAGQLLARIDTALLDADVAAAQARLQQAQAQAHQARLAKARAEALFASAALDEAALEAARADAAVREAEVRAAEVSAGRARRNRAYADITAPIGGTILRRDVELGQTVNAGFSAPTLFVLAGDTRKLELLANVDEADIGRVNKGMTARVTVSAWPDLTFPGTVQQVRLQASLTENVVTFPVVIEVDNADGKLFPGMTASVELIVAEAKGVLCAPNAALRFKPAADPGATGGKGAPERGKGERGKGGGRGKTDASGTLWTLSEGGAPAALPVTVGLRGAYCAEVSAEGLAEGVVVITGAETPTEGGAASPFSRGGTSGGTGPRAGM